jgi:hypothetical protein
VTASRNLSSDFLAYNTMLTPMQPRGNGRERYRRVHGLLAVMGTL